MRTGVAVHADGPQCLSREDGSFNCFSLEKSNRRILFKKQGLEIFFF